MNVMDMRERLKKNYALAMQQVAGQITSGQCTDFADYRGRCGMLKGMQKMIDVNDQIFDKIAVEEDGAD
jgi:hypothetical protein